jgi:hypothetical protein
VSGDDTEAFLPFIIIPHYPVASVATTANEFHRDATQNVIVIRLFATLSGFLPLKNVDPVAEGATGRIHVQPDHPSDDSNNRQQ